MQSFNHLTPQGPSLATHFDSGTNSAFILRRRRRKGQFVNTCTSQNFGVSATYFGCRTQNQILRHGFVLCSLKFNGYKAKMGSLSRPLTLVLALEREAVVHVHFNEMPDSDEPTSEELSCDYAKIEDIVDNEVVEEKRIDVELLGFRLCGAKTADDVDEVLKSYDEIPLRVYSTIIKAYGNEKKLAPAFPLVEWLKRHKKDTNGEIGPNLFIYNSLLGAVKESEQFEKISGIIEEMKTEGVVPNIVIYNALMSGYVEEGRYDEAFAVLDEIVENGLSPSHVTYSTMLLAYREMGNASGAVEFFVKLREKYERGDLVKDRDCDWDAEFGKLENFTLWICYQLMRQCLVKEGCPPTNMFRILSAMDKARLKLGWLEFERLIWACTREDNYTLAWEFYGRIRDINCPISLSVCNHVIWLMGKARKWWAALEIYEDLLDKGPKPNNLSYELIVSHFNTLLTAARRKGIWKWGVRLINKMVEKGLKPGTREWNAVIVACSKTSETNAAVQIFKRMVEQGAKPTILSYGALLSALEKGKLYDEALKVWEHMCKVGVRPNLHAYTILVSVYIGKGMVEMVDSVLEEMAEAKIEPTVVTFNAIITGFGKKKMSGVAFEWFNQMKVKNIKPNVTTYEMLIDALANDGKPRLAYEMYLKARNEGLDPSRRVYDAAVESCRYYNTDLNMKALGPRPLEKKELKQVIQNRKNLTEFCHMADVPRRSRRFDKSELYTS